MRRGDGARVAAMARGRAQAREARTAAQARWAATVAIPCVFEPSAMDPDARWCDAHRSDDIGSMDPSRCWTAADAAARLRHAS